MTAPARNLRTPAETELVERYGRMRAELPGAETVRGVREKAFARFERAGLPHRRVEEWKYSDLRARLKSAAPLAPKPDAAAARAALEAAEDPLAEVERYRLVLVDGFFQPELSDREALLAEKVEVAPLSELLALDGEQAAGLLGAPETASNDIAVALNTAFVADGVVVHIADGAVPSKPIEIVHVATSEAAAARYARIGVDLGRDAVATVVVNAVGGADGSETNLVVDHRLGENARLTAVQRQSESLGATHVTTTFARLSARSELRHLSLAAGGGFARNQSFVTFAGEGAQSDLFGVTMLDGSRHIDQTLVVEHAVPHGKSTEMFKAAVDGRASGVFQGKILVQPGAQKTDGKMMSQALLLTDEAQMSAKPELEIFADDVICGHGATSGRIDEDQLFYLMARGIPRLQAEQLLIEAFLDEPIDGIGHEALAEALRATVSGWLERRGGSAS